MKIGFAQEPQFSQFYAAPLYLNPAFAGNTISGRIAGSYRHQWPSIGSAFKTYSLSWDHNFEAQNSGVGLSIVNDVTGENALTYKGYAGYYSYAVNVSRDIMLRCGLKGGYISRGVDPSGLVYPDQLVSGATQVSQGYNYPTVNHMDFGGGVLLYAHDYWLGASMDHMYKGNQSLFGRGTIYEIPAKYSIHGGFNYHINHDVKGRPISTIVFSTIYKAQQKWDQLDVGAYYYYAPLEFGIWYRGLPGFKSFLPKYRNNEAWVLLVGYQLDIIRIGYSYDVTISGLSRSTGGAHEISITAEYPFDSQKRGLKSKKFLVPCAKF